MGSERARRWIVTVAAVVGVLVTARLGVWQLDRAGEKQALHDAIVQRASMPSLAPGELAREAGQAAAQHHRLVRLTGRWLAAHTVYLDNRQMDGRPGFFVVTPLLLESGDAVVVQRGWVPRDFTDRTKVPVLPAEEGPVKVAGRVAPPPSKLFEFEGVDSGPIRQNLDLSSYARQVGVALRPLSVLQLEDGRSADGLLRHWPEPSADMARNRGYAFQWFALSALIAGLYAWFQLIRPRRAVRPAA